MHPLLKLLLALVFLLPCAVMLTLWSWLADREEATVFEIPRGVILHDHAIYYLVIGKEQINPAGTVWKETSGPGWLSLEPLVEGPTLQKTLRADDWKIENNVFEIK